MPNDMKKGDLISREALLEQHDLKNAVKYGNHSEEQRRHSYSTLMLYEVADMVLDAPAVDAVPVVHGRWIERETEKPLILRCVMCSECGTMYQRRHKAYLNYCPNCGAKMDLEG